MQKYKERGSRSEVTVKLLLNKKLDCRKDVPTTVFVVCSDSKALNISRIYTAS